MWTLSRQLRGYFLTNALLVLVVIGGCDPSGSEGVGFVSERDSLGVIVVTSHVSSPMWGESEEWSIASSPALRLGQQEGRPEELFSTVSDVLVLENGSIIVLDEGVVRLFDAEGGFRRQVTGPGEGPSELRFPTGRALVDLRSEFGIRDINDLLRFDLEGEFIERETVAPSILQDLAGPRAGHSTVDILPDGTRLLQVMSEVSVTRLGAVFERKSIIALADVATQRIDTLETLSKRGNIRLQLGELGLNASGLFFGDPWVEASRSGRIALGNGNDFEIRLYNPEGDLERIVRLRGTSGPVSDSLIAAERESWEDRWESMQVASTDRERLWSQLPVSDSLPHFTQFQFDAKDNIWVHEFTPGGNSPRWWVFDPNGRYLGEIMVPEGLRVLDIGDDYLAGRRTDALDVPYVEKYSLMK